MKSLTRKELKQLYRIFIAAILLVICKLLPVDGLTAAVCYLVPYLFIGWDILSSLTLGIGNLWLRPYKQAANAAFYREISGTGYAAFDPSYS